MLSNIGNILWITAGGFLLLCFLYGFICGMLGINNRVSKPTHIPDRLLKRHGYKRTRRKAKTKLKPIKIPEYLRVYKEEEERV